MRTLFVLILFFMVPKSKALSQELFGEKLPKYPLKTISSYCQNKSDKSQTTTKLTYDDKKQLVKSVLYYDTVQVAEVIFNYNGQGQLVSKDFYSLNYQNQTMDYYRSRNFKYDSKNNLIHEGFDDDKGNDQKNNYTYDKDGKMLTSTDECNTRFIYSYKYDSVNKLIEKYKDGNLEISYEYDNNQLVKEIHYNRFRSYKKDQVTIYKYVYNEMGFLLFKTENENVIEKNIYDNNFLVERWTYYFGIDPCHSPCCGQYVFRYKYY